MKAKKFFSFFKNILFKNKFRMLFFVFFFFFFLLFSFPYSELTGFITSKLAQATKNRLLFQMKEIRPLFFPSLGLKLKEVNIVARGMSSPLEISQVKIALSLFDLFLFKMNYSLELQNLFESNVKIRVKRGKSAQDKKQGTSIKRKQIFLSIDHLNLNQAVKPFSKYAPKKGIGQGEVKGLINTQFNYPPEVKVHVQIKDFDFPSSSFETAFGPMNFPSIQFSSFVLKALLKEGTVTFEEVLIGSKNDPLFADIKGYLQVDLLRKNRRFKFNLKEYQIKVSFSLADALHEELSLFLSPLSKYKKTKIGKQTQYQFKVEGKGQRSIPRLSAL